METFWSLATPILLSLWVHLQYQYDSDFRFSLVHKRMYIKMLRVKLNSILELIYKTYYTMYVLLGIWVIRSQIKGNKNLSLYKI